MVLNYRAKKDTGPRTNEQITAGEVRVISSTGKQLGIISIREALNHAEDEGFDLVEVSPDAKPPVCKIIDYGKLKYREQISKKEDNKSNTLKDDLFHNIPLCIGLFLDGLIIGLQKNSSHVEGLALILACALSLDNLFVGLSIGNEIGDNIPLLIITSILLGLSVILGTISGIYSYDSLKNSPFLYTIISFGVTALLWETFQELMPDSRRLKNDSKDNTHYNLYGMYIGFLTVFMVSWLGK